MATHWHSTCFGCLTDVERGAYYTYKEEPGGIPFETKEDAQRDANEVNAQPYMRGSSMWGHRQVAAECRSPHCSPHTRTHTNTKL